MIVHGNSLKFILAFFIILYTPFSLGAVDSLVNALTQGKFSGEFNAKYSKGSDEEGSNNGAYQNIFIEYELPKIHGIDIMLGAQSVEQREKENKSVNQVLYSEAIYAKKAASFDYRLSANYYSTIYSPNEETQLVTSRAVGFKAEIEMDAFEAYVAISRVSDATHDFYIHPSFNGKENLLPTSSLLLSNNDMPNTSAAALDLKYRFDKQFSLGSRYAVAEDAFTQSSYSGIYSSFLADEVLKGLNVTIAYDRALEGDDARQWSIQFKSNF